MAKINPHYRKLEAGYLFPEIARRTRLFQEKNPDANLIRLGIGDTTRPITPVVAEGMKKFVDQLTNKETYSGYGAERGDQELRTLLAHHYKKYGVDIEPDEIFVSDGAKTDSSNIQSIFAADSIIAVQDPVYPVYVDSSVITGKTGQVTDGKYENLVYMDCTEENGFFPELPTQPVDIIYLCSPNNPTGTVATHEQLKTFVDYALENNAIIIFDAAYAEFIQDDSLPRSIYEIEGATKCAIEINSFSKWAGFTGIRLGWTIVPIALKTDDSEDGELNAMWNRRQSTMFNGASNVAQAGGRAVLSEQGLNESKELIDYYMQNATAIRDGLKAHGFTIFGGENAPYVWMKTPNGMTSWEFFDTLMEKAHVVGTPGAGFGSGGEGYFRLSAFGDHEQTLEAIERIKKMEV